MKSQRTGCAPFRARWAMAGLVLATVGAQSRAEMLTVTIENLAPQNGNFLTPVWVGFHDGTFDVFDLGSPASMSLERIAEDGNTGPLSMDFDASGAGSAQATIPGPGGPIAPGDIATFQIDVDGSLGTSRYFSFASMVIPSNDAFVGNDDPLAFRVFDDDGTFLGANFFITGSEVLDAGTEVNTEIPLDTAFFGQLDPDTGTDEGGVVALHPGFLPAGSGGILDDPMFANADFTVDGYPIAQIRVVPEPSTAALLAVAGVLALRSRPRRARH